MEKKRTLSFGRRELCGLLGYFPFSSPTSAYLICQPLPCEILAFFESFSPSWEAAVVGPPNCSPQIKMGESQLKRLKASLRAAGITGQQKPKKASTKARQSSATNNSRLDRNVALQSIREEFNPFEIKTTREKHDIGGRRIKGAQGRPGLSKQIGEDNVGFYFYFYYFSDISY